MSIKQVAPDGTILSGWRAAGMARRRYQRGSITQDGDRWIARWREDVVLPSGEIKRPRRSEIIASLKECPTKRLAQRRLDERLDAINRTDYRPRRAETFRAFAARWMASVMVHHKPSSQQSERSVIQVHLIPAFGRWQLVDISAEWLQAWVSEQTLGPKTITNMIRTLKTMWIHAKEWGYCQHDPFQRLRLPAVVKGNTYHFTIEETVAIIDKAQGRWKTLFRILAETGIRPGEAAGLRAEEVGRRSLRVSQSVWLRQVQHPKTPNAIRTCAISANLAEEIRSMGITEGLLFRAADGRPLSMESFRHCILNPILEELGILAKVRALGVRCGNYAFRHMNATLMDRLATPLKTRQKRLGHAKPETTLIHYTHPIDQEDMAVADQIGALLDPAKARVVQ